MLKLTKDDIHLEQEASNKQEAIKKIASALVTAQYVENGYVDGMLERESQAATYLGNGIAIPHGTPKTRHLVKKTGVQVFHFPQGVAWGDDGEKAYIAIGIAASNNEHLSILKQLTHVLGDDDIEERIKNIKTVDEALALLTGKTTEAFVFDENCLLLDIKADNLAMLQALNGSRLKSERAVDSSFLLNVLDTEPNYLGQGVWLSDSAQGNLKNGIAITRTNSDISQSEKPVKLLITMSVVDDTTDFIVENLSKLAFNQSLDKLVSASSAQLIALLSGQDVAVSNSPSASENNLNDADQTVTGEFVVLNPNGLHTRPSSTLVKLVKEFNSKITVANLDGTGVAVSATSLMKIVGLGAKKGSHLQFIAQGDDAQKAIDAIGAAIASGLGEGVE